MCALLSDSRSIDHDIFFNFRMSRSTINQHVAAVANLIPIITLDARKAFDRV